MTSESPHHVVVAGGGLAALETVLALHHHAGSRVRITLVTRQDTYAVRAMGPAAVFDEGAPEPLSIAGLTGELGATLVAGELVSVDVPGRRATTDVGDSLAYDTLVVATGARMTRPLPGTFTFALDDPAPMADLLLDLEEDYEDAVAFVIPPGPTWPLPAYELALRTTARVQARGRSPQVTVVTAEQRPLAAFGAAVSEALERLLDAAHVQVHLGATGVTAPDGALTVVPSGARLDDHRVVALPRLEGQPITGLPTAASGFLGTDAFGRVTDAPGVYAVGDVADWPIKHGSLAAEQADAAAEHIAAAAGADLEPAPFEPVLRGVLLTHQDGTDRAGGGLHFWPPAKLAARFLSARLGGGAPDAPRPDGIPVEVPLQAALWHGAPASG